MRPISPQADWPQSWRTSYEYDLQEVYSRPSHLGYAYSYANRRRQTLKLLTEVLPPGASVLDIAAAQGNFSLTLAEMGYRVTWNDLRAELAGYVQLKHESGDLEFAPGNAFELRFGRQFDAVLITEVIEHVAHPDQFLASVKDLVKPGGYIVMTTPNGGYFRNSLPRFSECPDPSVFESRQFGPNGEDHVFLLHEDEVRRFSTLAGLEVERLALFTNPLTNGHMKLNPVLSFLPRQVVQAVEAASQYLPSPLARRLLISLGARLRKPTAAHPVLSFN